MEPVATLVIPAYNSEKFLKKCLDSTAAQTFLPLECIVIDDGSTDGTPGLLDACAAKDPALFRVVHRENGGVSSARDLGASLAQGKYLLFADNDDYMEPEYVRTLVDAIERTGADMVVAGFHRTAEDGHILYTRKPRKGEWSKFCFTAPWARIMRTDFVRENGLKFGDFRLGEDAYFAVSAYDASPRIETIPYAGYHWIDHPSSVSNTVQKRLSDVSALDLLKALKKRIPEPHALSREMYDYFFIKYIAFHLTFLAGSASPEELRAALAEYHGWLNENLPFWRKNPLVSPFGPEGELFSVRLTVWLLTKASDETALKLLGLYGKLKKKQTA